MANAFIALGSNLGDRQENLRQALKFLGEQAGIRVLKASSFVETAPVGGPPGQGAYLNAAAELQTDLPPRELLNKLLELERRLGRVRGEPNAPRTIDLDLLLYGQQVLKEPDLHLPHPRMHERWFVLAPLSEIAAEVKHPVLGRSIRELLQALTPESAQGGPIPSRDLAGLRGVVTGSTSGIGKAIALELARAGANLIIHGRQSSGKAESVAREAQQQGVRAKVILADLHQANECNRLMDAAWQEWGGLDIWINNAGVDTLTGEAAKWPFERKWTELLAVDVTGTITLSRLAGDRMKAQGRGVIINMGWDQAETGMAGESGQMFAAAKGAIMAFSKSLAMSLAPSVRVNCLAPGWIRTAWGESAQATWQERVLRETPLARWGTPEDVARTVHWLVSPGAGFITGQVIRINGGAVR